MSMSSSRSIAHTVVSLTYSCHVSSEAYSQKSSVCKAPESLQFDDHRTVFHHKNTWELLRGLLVLRACGSDFLVDNSLKLLRYGQGILGEKAMAWILHPTLYSQFVAGQEESDLAATSEALRKLSIRLMLAPTLEEDVGEGTISEEKYDKNLEEMFRLAELTQRHGGIQPCLQTKITAMISADVLCKLSSACSNEKLDTCTKMVEQIADAMANGQEVQNIPGINRKDQQKISLAVFTCDIATTKKLQLLVDAEYSYVNPGCSLLTLAMMTVFNQHQPVVANTYQCYFKKAMDILNHELDITGRLGACLAIKLVRGAYLEKERKMDPLSVCESHTSTGENYERVLERALKHTVEAGAERSFIIIATHNEGTVRHAVSRLQQLGLDHKAGHVVFAQIYGMAEQISMPLAQAGYIVYKSVPMGSLNQVLPYLARRAAENRSVLQGARKEREMLQQELSWRLKTLLHS